MTDQTNAVAKAEPKPPIVAGGGMAAIVPQDIEQTFRLSQALARGGDMVPKHFQGQPEQIMAAIMRGMEIGLAPMQALSNIAVINGRATVWGDALPALMQRAGHSLDVVIEGDGENMVARATLKRGDTGQTVVREFSVADAKKANLWGKQGPWQTYPKRMLSMRARAWAVRDGAADALMGLQVAEEMQDAPPMRDVTPKVSSRMQEMVAKARGQDVTLSEVDQRPAQEPEDISQDIEGEAQHWTASIDTNGAFPGNPAWDEGVKAAQAGEARETCPYEDDPEKACDWLGAFDQAQEAAK